MTKKRAPSVRWSSRATRDLEEIATYIARDDPKAAREWIAKLRRAAVNAAHTPLAARIVPELRRDDVREVFLRSHRIVYGARDDHIFVFTVFGGGKQLAVPEE